MDDGVNGKLPGILADIRETETPGRRGGVSHYARAVYACFDEIRVLTSEGFTLATICDFLKKKGILPAGADARSFCRAFRRERMRREQAEKRKNAKKKGAAKNDGAVKLAGETSAKQEPGASAPQHQATVKPDDGRLRLEPGNTFKIKPINPNDLPDFEDLTKRR
jgi:DNA-binding transcriptional MerR regulator